jgi:hypothetical protein
MIKALLAIVLSILSLPVIGILMLFDFSPSIPIDAYEYMPTDTLLATQIEDTVSSLQAGQLMVELDEQFINQFLYSYFVESINPDYDPGSSCESEACEFLVSNSDQPIGTVGVTGIWVRLFNNVISVNVGLRTVGIPFQTRVRFDFEVIDNPDVFEINYSRLQVGNVPLPAFVVRPIINAILGESDVSQTTFGGNGIELDVQALSLTVDKGVLIEESLTDQAALVASLIVKEELVRFEVDGQTSRLKLFVDVDKLFGDVPLKQYSGDASVIFAALFVEILSEVEFDLIEGITLTTSEFFLSEEDLNIILSPQFQDFNSEELFGSSAVSSLLTIQPPWVELEGATLSLIIPVVLMDKTIPIEIVMTSLDGYNDLVLQVESISIGKDDSKTLDEYVLIQGDQIQPFLAQLSLDGLFEVLPNSRNIKVPVDTFNQAVREITSRLNVTRIGVVDGQFLLNIELA